MGVFSFFGKVVDFFEEAADAIVDFVEDYLPGRSPDLPDQNRIDSRNRTVLLNKEGAAEPITTQTAYPQLPDPANLRLRLRRTL